MATFYVANAGNDGNAGTIASPWKTVAAVNSITFAPGDQILFRRGDTWKETLSPRSSGTVGNNIVFSAYGNGVLPVIGGRGTVSGWSTTGNWTNQGSNRWSKSQSNSVSYRIRVWADGTEMERAKYTSDVNATTNFYYTSSVLWVYATSNPASYYSSMEMSGVYGYAINMSSRNYLTFENINFSGGGWSYISLTSCSYIIFDGCSIGNGAPASGITSTSSTHCEVMNCIFDTGDRTMDTWQAENSEDGLHLHNGSQYWEVHDNTFRDWGHCCFNFWGDTPSNPVTDINAYDNYFTNEDIDYASAFSMSGLTGCITRVHIYRNNMYKMATYNQFAARGGEIWFYDNIMDGTRGFPKEGKNGYGIGILAYGSAEGIAQKFYNNTVVNCKDGGILLMNYGALDIYDNEIINNIFAENGVNNNDVQIEIAPNGGGYHVLDNVFRNNLLYSSATTDVVQYGHAPSGQFTYITVAEFNAFNGTEGDTIVDNVYGDPLFVSAVDFHLQAGSPAIGMGYTPTLSSADYDNRPFASPPSAGAYEAGSTPIVSPAVPIPVTSVTIYGAGNETIINVDNGTLQMYAIVLPVNADDTSVTWSVINGTGSASISATGLLTAITNGTVTVKATSNG